MTPGISGDKPAPDREDRQMAVTAEVEDGVGWITLDRPPDNTYDAAFLEELDRCVGEVAEAERLGMVDRLVPAGEFDEAVAGLAAGLAAGPPLAVAAITRVVNDGLECSLADALDRELEELATLFATEDAREGMMAFTEKRPPKYTGR
jgi:enoyl-CoA hydratase/carnithine racemase